MPSEADILCANLAGLRPHDAALAERLEQTPPAALQWARARDGQPTASLMIPGRSITLASRYEPLAEARRLTAAVDLQKHAGVFVLGLGVGHHVAHLAGQLRPGTVMVVYEPDLALLRAVLQRLDCASWLGKANVVLAAGQVDRGALLARLEPFMAYLTMGAVLVHHPPTQQLHPQAVADFSNLVTEVIAYCRTSVATALVNSSRTVRNLCCNLGYYAAGANTNELHQAAAGYPGICVGAGPSLARNVDLLRDPQVRRRVVLICAQTTLKPLLDRGIQPDYVTALDYHEISRRFYEGLPALPRVTLVAEAKSHQAILDSFPGPVRITANRFLRRLLGREAPAITPIEEGATVAHLSFYLARHLGCDPIILIGQDLGFSDGLYYCPGTAIHEVWAPELNAFNTVEMMEWQRVVRHRLHLRKMEDIHGRPAYSDEQMLTYLKQFERDFGQSKQQVIDATEGGLPKKHTVPMPLAQALARHATRPWTPPAVPAGRFDPPRLVRAREVLRQRLAETRELRQLSQRTAPLLKQLLKDQADAGRFAGTYRKIEPLKKRVAELDEAFGLINELNTIGAFKRARADRAIATGQDEEAQRQRRQIERDIENVDWLSQACDEALAIFEEAEARLAAQVASEETPGAAAPIPTGTDHGRG